MNDSLINVDMLTAVSFLRRIDWLLFLSVLTLSGLGLLAIWSIDLAQDPENFARFKKQMVFAAAGIVVAFAGAWFDYRALRSWARPLYAFGLALLFAVLFFGITLRGTTGWFTFGNFTFQPVEFTKVILIVVLARYLDKQGHIVDWKMLAGAGVLAGLYAALVLAQPDFGSALILIALTVGLLLLTNVPRRYIIRGILAAAVVSVISWQFVFQEYQKDRIVSFLNPGADPFNRGYNIRQSVIAVGSGGMFGRGLSEATQSQLKFLPEAQTDFIFAVLAEQLGFLGVVVIFAAYLALIWRVALLVHRASDGFGMFCAAGFMLMVAVQAILNIGMNLGVLPIVGLPLPFVSLGGSAMLANFLMLGVVQSIRVRG